jgi:hypothetical protein
VFNPDLKRKLNEAIEVDEACVITMAHKNVTEFLLRES